MSTPAHQLPLNATAADQSRPRETKNKSFGFLLKKMGKRRGHHESTTMTAAAATRKPHTARTSRRRHNQALPAITPVTVAACDNDIMSWLENECPQDLLPRILAFSGPQTTRALSRTCRFWNGLIKKESTWKVLCEELYKWREGDKEPTSWRDFYKYNPCVPVDYSTVDGALSVVQGHRGEQTRSIHVLLRPGRYVLREAITVQAPRSVRVRISTMQMSTSFHPVDQAVTFVETEPVRKRKKSLRKLLTCQSNEAVDQEEEHANLEMFDSSMLTSPRYPVQAVGNQRATLVLRTPRHNEPIIRVCQGSAFLQNLELRHASRGLDIWNGNAAIQIQPINGPDDRPIAITPLPTLTMEHVEVSSASGRGIVNIDGGQLDIRNCYVHDCAATGIYVGAPGTRVHIENTDVIQNGRGNMLHRRGIARGHSGVYLEQGHAHILNCSISRNSLTGISAVSPENAILDLQDSELVSNGSFQLEMPGVGSFSHSRSTSFNNTLSAAGFPRARSGLTADDDGSY